MTLYVVIYDPKDTAKSAVAVSHQTISLLDTQYPQHHIQHRSIDYRQHIDCNNRYWIQK